jgi:hypothetical protein
MFMTVGMRSSLRTGATCRMAGCSSGANMNTMPASSSTRPMPSGVSSMRTSSASRISALPHRDENERLPCLAMRTPAPAATRAAAVEMLNVVSVPPPVPHVSTSWSVSLAGTGTMARRSARTPPATTPGDSRRVLSATSSAAIWTGVALPSMTMENAASASAASSGSGPVARAMSSPRSGPGAGPSCASVSVMSSPRPSVRDPVTGATVAGSRAVRKVRRACAGLHERVRGVI